MAMKLYESYKWTGDHDPIIDRMRTLVEDEGLSYAKVSELTGLSPTTLNNWFNRSRRGNRKPTMRPMFASVMAVTRGLGYDLAIVRPERKVSAGSNVKISRNVAAKAGVGMTPH